MRRYAIIYSMKGVVIMGKEMETTKIRDEFIERVKQAFEEQFDAFCLITGSGVLALPGVDADGNEFYYKIQISVPRGSRDGKGGYIPWDAEFDAKEYQRTDKEQTDHQDRAVVSQSAQVSYADRIDYDPHDCKCYLTFFIQFLHLLSFCAAAKKAPFHARSRCPAIRSSSYSSPLLAIMLA